MSVILFDNRARNLLYPFTLTRAVGALRFGAMTAAERWERITGRETLLVTEPYLQDSYPPVELSDHIWIDASVMVSMPLAERILALPDNTCLVDDNGLIAGRGTVDAQAFDNGDAERWFAHRLHADTVRRLAYPWQMMQWNDEMIRFDYALLTAGRASQPLPQTVNAIAPDNIFVEPGARLSYCTINAATGPVYIGRDAEIMEGSVIRGPFVLGKNSVVKMNSRIYGATTLGPGCLGGGEIKNTVMMGYSNKAHDGYLGDSVIGEWCNFGAGSTNSNIKNTAGTVKVWVMAEQRFEPVGQKCGMIMGDYSRVSINASINTGAAIGICSNVFGEGLLPVAIHSFSWGVKGNTYTLDKALEDIGNWKKLKGQYLTEKEEMVLRYIFANL